MNADKPEYLALSWGGKWHAWGGYLTVKAEDITLCGQVHGDDHNRRKGHIETITCKTCLKILGKDASG